MKALECARRAPGRPAAYTLFWWTFIRGMLRLWLGLCYRYRGFGAELVPGSGPIVYMANHQSHLDPVLAGVLVHDRPFASLARESLFRFRPFGWLIRTLNAIPLQREGSDVGALRAGLRELEAGRAILVFPEGTRTVDGTCGAFRGGAVLLAKRGRATIVPLAIEGAFDVWPRGRTLPRVFGRILVRAGEPVPHERLERDGTEETLLHLRRSIETMRLELRARMSGRPRA